jgi:hypothetical protein
VCLYGGLLLTAYLGGPALRLAALLAALLIPLCDWSGLLRHSLYLGGAIAGGISASLLAGAAGGVLAVVVGPLLGLLGGILVAGGAPLLLAIAIGRRLQRGLGRHRYLYVVNHAGGALCGVLEGFALALVTTWLLSLFGPTLQLTALRFAPTHPRMAAVLAYLDQLGQSLAAGDTLGAWCERVNPLRDLPQLVAVAAAAECSADREAFWQAWDDGVFNDLLDEPAIQRHYCKFAENPRLREAVKTHDMTALLSSGEFADALADDELCQAVAKHWPEIRARVGEARIARARSLANQFDGAARAKVQEAQRRAAELGVQLP